MSISVEATGKILYLQFVFHMRLVSFEVRSVVTLLKCKLRNELISHLIYFCRVALRQLNIHKKMTNGLRNANHHLLCLSTLKDYEGT